MYLFGIVRFVARIQVVKVGTLEQRTKWYRSTKIEEQHGSWR